MGENMNDLRRFEDWPYRLEAFLEQAADRSFACGAFDCVLMACAAVEAMTGQDFGVPFRGQYDDAAGAQAIIDRDYEGALDRAVTQFLGAPLPGVKKAQRGDVVMFRTAEGPALGVVDMSGMRFAAIAPSGLIRLPLRAALQAWRV